MRHGESLGNVDENTYVTTPDWRIPLTERGNEQAAAAGKRLASLLGPRETAFIYNSPYVRTQQTTDHLVEQIDAGSDEGWDRRVLARREDPRISEQQFGNYQDYDEVQRAKKERANFGRFFYRFPDGEAGLDVFNRVTGFISTLFRDSRARQQNGQDMANVNVIIVTHGLTLRLLIMRWFHLSVEDFERMWNPDNAFLAVMERKTSSCGSRAWFELTETTREHLHIPASAFSKLAEKRAGYR